jgi:hypothetical protein
MQKILELNPRLDSESQESIATIEELAIARERVITSANLWFIATTTHDRITQNGRVDLDKLTHDTKRRALENLENDLVEYGQKAGLL